MANVLITGASGYLGGSLLAYLSQNQNTFPLGTTLFSLVRSEDQAEKTRSHYGIEPITVDLNDEASILKALEEKNITIVAFLIDARSSEVQIRIIKALAKIQEKTGKQTHLIQTSGAKGFSSHAYFPLEPPIGDEDERLFEIHKEQRGKSAGASVLAEADVAIIEAAEEYGVRAYIVAPCIVYGEGEGFGNRVSIQTKAVVKAAKATRKVYSVDQGNAIWPVCHVRDQSSLYVCLLNNILGGIDVGYNKTGFYLASPGPVAWKDLYAAMAKRLYERGLIDDDNVYDADQAALARMAEGLEGGPDMVSLHMGGVCTWVPKHARSIGWRPEYRPEHIFEAAGAEVDLILKHL